MAPHSCGAVFVFSKATIRAIITEVEKYKATTEVKFVEKKIAERSINMKQK